MSKSRDIVSHAPLLARLRGYAFLPGVHYVDQASTWMREAADRIETLESVIRQTDDENLKRKAGLCSCSSEWDKYCPIHGKNSRA